MQQAMQGMPVEDFQNVVPLENLAGAKQIQVDTPDTAPPADVTEQGLTETAAPEASPSAPTAKPATGDKPPAPAPTPKPESPPQTP